MLATNAFARTGVARGLDVDILDGIGRGIALALGESLPRESQDIAPQVQHWIDAIPAQRHVRSHVLDVISYIQVYSRQLLARGEPGPSSGEGLPDPEPAGCRNELARRNALLYLADQLQRHKQLPACRLLLQTVFSATRSAAPDQALAAPPDVMGRLCAEALQAGIAVAHVKRLIVRHKLIPDPSASIHWPWPVKIYTLGRFSIFCEDQALTFTSKSPRKALELLQAVIAHGGRDVHSSVLMHSLWPEESSSNLRNLFDNTLHRLRRILDPVDVVHLHNAKLTLDPASCWVDAWAFGRLTASCIDSAAGNHAPMAISDEEAQTALRLYNGHFLQCELEEPWSLPYRDRLRNRFQRLVRFLGARLEAAGQWVAAAEAYERGIEVDNLAECFYQRLMVCHQQRGEHAEAIRVYRRCRELLSIVLGIAPSATTEKIRQASGCAKN